MALAISVPFNFSLDYPGFALGNLRLALSEVVSVLNSILIQHRMAV